jgi:hypothetical protein
MPPGGKRNNQRNKRKSIEARRTGDHCEASGAAQRTYTSYSVQCNASV